MVSLFRNFAAGYPTIGPGRAFHAAPMLPPRSHGARRKRQLVWLGCQLVSVRVCAGDNSVSASLHLSSKLVMAMESMEAEGMAGTAETIFSSCEPIETWSFKSADHLPVF